MRADPGRRIWVALGLVAAAAVAVAVRGSNFPHVFGEDGSVFLHPYDAAYHARRALYSFVHFPRVLGFDPYIAFPDGAPVPMPPLYDWALGAVARLFGRSTHTFELVAAWSSPILAAVTLLPVFAAARRLGGTAAGMAAGWIFALLPASSYQSAVGYADHHAAVVLLGACLLASSLADARPRSAVVDRWTLLHAAALAGLVLVWSGSLLYVGLAETCRLIASGVVAPRPARLCGQAVAALGAAVLVALWVAALPTPREGAFTATTLSWLHPLALLGVAALCTGLAAVEARWGTSGASERALVVSTLGLFLGGVAFLLVPGLGEAFTSGLGFLAKQDAWAPANPEQVPLLDATLRETGRGPLSRFGLLALLVPPAIAWMAWRVRRDPDPAPGVILLGWTATLSVLALSQVRYAQDLAPAVAIASAVLMSSVVARVASPRAGVGALALLVALALVPTFRVHVERVQTGLHGLRPGPRIAPRESIYRFGEAVQRATPETSGFLDPAARPEYGLLVPPAQGHAMLYAARRPVSANGFGPYLDPAKYQEVVAFYGARTESEALAAARALSARYAMTMAGPSQDGTTFTQRLHADDGSGAAGIDAAQRFRLVTEGPAGGLAMQPFLGRGGARAKVPYKLFEIVAGAVLEVRGTPGSTVTAQLALQTPVERRRWTGAGRIDATGRARLRVPYATEPQHAVTALGAYEVRVGDATHRVRVPEAAVREGRTLEVGGAAAP